MIGQLLSNYKILSEIGQGGMSNVYLAENLSLRSQVALKVLKDEYVRDRNVRSRFISEAKNMSQIKHPNIVQVYDLIDAGDIVAIVMEYVEDLSLKQYLEQKKQLDDLEIKRLLQQMLKALEHIHDAGFVHRDIKPSNFLMCKNDLIKLADFGIAKNVNEVNNNYTMTGVQMGTPMYMSPEQIRSTKDVDFRSDIYSLGVVLFEMANGSLPSYYLNHSLPEVQVSILRTPLPNTNSKWDIMISKATEKQIDIRYENCRAWMTSLNFLNVQKHEFKPHNIHLISVKQNPITNPNHILIASCVSFGIIALVFFVLFNYSF